VLGQCGGGNNRYPAATPTTIGCIQSSLPVVFPRMRFLCSTLVCLDCDRKTWAQLRKEDIIQPSFISNWTTTAGGLQLALFWSGSRHVESVGRIYTYYLMSSLSDVLKAFMAPMAEPSGVQEKVSSCVFVLRSESEEVGDLKSNFEACFP
jgi:hypothetical protein